MKNSGFTLVGMVFALGLSSVVVGSISSVMIHASKTSRSVSEKSELASVWQAATNLFSNSQVCSCIMSSGMLSFPEGSANPVVLPEIRRYDEDCTAGTVLLQNGQTVPNEEKYVASLSISEMTAIRNREIYEAKVRFVAEANPNHEVVGGGVAQFEASVMLSTQFNNPNIEITGCTEVDLKSVATGAQMVYLNQQRVTLLSYMAPSALSFRLNNGKFVSHTSAIQIWNWEMDNTSAADQPSTIYYLYAYQDPTDQRRYRLAGSTRAPTSIIPGAAGPDVDGAAWAYIGAIYNDQFRNIAQFLQVGSEMHYINPVVIQAGSAPFPDQDLTAQIPLTAGRALIEGTITRINQVDRDLFLRLGAAHPTPPPPTIILAPEEGGETVIDKTWLPVPYDRKVRVGIEDPNSKLANYSVTVRGYDDPYVRQFGR